MTADILLRGGISATSEEYEGFKVLMEEDDYFRMVGPKPISRNDRSFWTGVMEAIVEQSRK